MKRDSSIKDLNPPIKGVFVFWGCCVLVITGFALKGIFSFFFLLFIIPVFYGTHEALHDSLIPKKGLFSKNRSFHNELVLNIGFSLQIMNFKLLRPGHLHHHSFGRYDDGYAPDVFNRKPTLKDKFLYYVTLMGLPAFAWQCAGFVKLVVPPQLLPFLHNIKFDNESSKTPYIVAQISVLIFVLFAIIVGGLTKFIFFEVFLISSWSLLQNVSHYGTKGIDPRTDRVCARTYFLEEPFKTLTFGSTSHLAHHVFMDIPGPYLYSEQVIKGIEKSLNAKVIIKYGVVAFIKDVLRQFMGPLQEDDLKADWFQPKPRKGNEFYPLGFGFRGGRTWRKN